MTDNEKIIVLLSQILEKLETIEKNHEPKKRKSEVDENELLYVKEFLSMCPHGVRIDRKQLYSDYLKKCANETRKALTKNFFFRTMRKCGIVETRNNKGTRYVLII